MAASVPKFHNYPAPKSLKRALVDSFGRVNSPATGKPYQRGVHGGIDVPPSAPGKTGEPITPVLGGRVVFAEPADSSQAGTWGSSYGNRVLIVHSAGGKILGYSFYAHLAHLNVKTGDKVTVGTVLGGLGASGSVSGAHCHFEWHTAGSGGQWKRGFINPYHSLEEQRMKLLAA
jgi:murein DD-endopeptidase MepM/ murein hydrolase activator NlpD